MSEFKETLPQISRPELQRPDLGIEAVERSNNIYVTQDMYPWINIESLKVPTVLVKMEGMAQPIRFGSIVNGNNTLEKIADSVPKAQSKKAERGMFQAALPLAENKAAPTIDRIDVGSSEITFKTAQHGSDVARLFFSVSKDKEGILTFLKLAVAPHKKQQQLLSVLRGNNVRRKMKRD